MPMTAAHPLAVLPLRRTNLDWTCLVIGSMAPDFEYFLRLDHASNFSHTWLGLVVFCVPLTLCAAWLFHNVIKRPFVQVVPAALGARLVGFVDRPWRLTASCVAAAIAGTLTHDLWDGFTHPDMWGPRHILWLSKVVVVHGHATLVCRVLQNLSTVIGLFVLSIIAWRTLARTPPRPVTPATLGQRLVWLACILLAGAVAFARMYVATSLDPGSVAVAAIDAVLFGGLLACLITR